MKNKEKYDLRDISYTLKAGNGGYDFAIYCNSIEIHRESFCGINSVCCTFTKWLEEEYVPNILTDKEKAYLSAVIKPFRERIECVKKIVFKRAFIKIFLEDEAVALPYFAKDIMYTGMEEGREYTLEELGLWRTNLQS